MSNKIDQKEYLKKYLSGGKNNDKKKKKKRTKVTGVGMKIIDADDMDLSKMRVLESHELDLFGDKEDAPQVVGIIDDRPEEMKKLENFSNDKWKVINRDDGYNASITIEQIHNKKQSHKMIDNDSDLSPQKDSYDSDLSPDRTSQQKRNNKALPSAKPRAKRDSDSDLSPLRNREGDIGHKRLDKSKIKTERNSSDSDLSPPRNTKTNMRKKEDRLKVSSKDKKNDQLMYIPNSDSDLSPPRNKEEKTNTTAQVSLSEKKGRMENKIEDVRLDKKKDGKRKKSRWNESDDDDTTVSSNKEKDKTNKSDGKDSHQYGNKNFDRIQNSFEYDQKRNKDKHFNISRKNTDRDRSPIDKRRQYEDNRRNNSDRHRSGDLKEKLFRHNSDHKNRGFESRESETSSRNQKMDKTLDGKRAGLQDARQLKTENDEFRRKENELFGKLSEEFTGKNAQTVKRDMRTGKPRDTEEEMREQLEKEEKQKVTDGKYSRWGKGLKQIEEQEAKVKEYLHEASKPLARYKDDQDLDKALMGRERTGDPMLEYMRKVEQEKMKTDGYEAPPIYKGPYPPNRFDIRPGHRWDGVDRSNGHEKNYFQAKSNRKALDAESYKWSTEDM